LNVEFNVNEGWANRLIAGIKSRAAVAVERICRVTKFYCQKEREVASGFSQESQGNRRNILA
jgi:hypothetical protein